VFIFVAGTSYIKSIKIIKFDVLMRMFFRMCVSSLSRRGLLFVVVSAFYFGSMLLAALLAQTLYSPFYEGRKIEGLFLVDGLPLMILSIFLFNLIVSAFIFVTLPGLVFFVFPVIMLLMRAVVWGASLNQLPTPLFLAALPTLILEGEGYVIASIGGINLGLSWLKPYWVYKGESLSRLEALKRALRECAHLFVFVTVLLFAAALVEAVTLTLSPF